MSHDPLAVISLGAGSLQSGFAAVTVHLWEPSSPYPMKFVGSLPAAPHIAPTYQSWQLLYTALCHRLAPRLEVDAADVTNVSEADFSDLCQRLTEQINQWLKAESFRAIDQQLRTCFTVDNAIRLLIETDDLLVQRLPWHLWDFLKAYPKAEVALSATEYQRPAKLIRQESEPFQSPSRSEPIRILAVLGNSQGISLDADRAFLEQLSHQAEIEFLVEPSRIELNDCLWQGWDILFFAGHSSSEKQGIIQLNQTETLSLEQLRYALSRAISPKNAIAHSLQLAIFNSCDGLGLARQLFDLHIPQVIVMREPVPNAVAQQFLSHFLMAFTSRQPLYEAVREAREQLQGLESTYPCASWLPVICQNPAVAPMTWPMREKEQEAERHGDAEIRRRGVKTKASLPAPIPASPYALLRWILLTSFATTALVMGVRWLGWLQPWELQTFDQLLRSRPLEQPDPRLLVITVTEADFQLPAQRQRQGSLSDQALTKLLDKVEPYQPRAIGLDIYRDFAASSTLAARLRRSDRLFAICKGRDPANQHPGVAPPPEVPLEHQGFSDILLDDDGVLRRHLIAMHPVSASPCSTPYALSAQLAFHYLAAEGLSAHYTPDGTLQIGTVPFHRLRSRMGGYQPVDAWGYQVLLNYRSSHPNLGIAATVTLSEVLAGTVNPEQIKDRIVLIGVTAQTAHDTVSTPYHRGFVQDMPGVMVQAQMTSQLLSAVKDGRPLLAVWSGWYESLWLWGWAITGGLLVAWGQPRSLRHWLLYRGVAVGIGLGGLTLACFVLLIRGYWVPLIPAGLALLGAGGAVTTLLYLPPMSNLEVRKS